MTEDTKAPLSWLKKIDEELIHLDEIPLLREPCAFSWETFSEAIASTFSLNSFSVSSSKQMIWREGDEITKGIGDECDFLAITTTPVVGDVFWVMSKEDIIKLTSKLLSNKSNSIPSSSLHEGFYRFLCLESLSNVEATPTFADLSLKINDNPSTSQKAALCIDIKISVDNYNCYGRLCITPTFRKSWEEFFAKFPPIAQKGLEKTLEVPIKIEAGYVNFSLNEWEKVSVGDFILLDKARINPKTNRGVVSLVLENTPLFQAKIKQEKIKILDYAYYEEETMDIEENNYTEEEMEEVEGVESIEEEPSPIKDLPISVVVEVARFRLTLEKLTQLQPGNFLELPVAPEQGVNLTINGKKIGRAELVRLGEALGIRILELGK